MWNIISNLELMPLPDGWKELETKNGQVIYIDDVTKKFQWNRPKNGKFFEWENIWEFKSILIKLSRKVTFQNNPSFIFRRCRSRTLMEEDVNQQFMPMRMNVNAKKSFKLNSQNSKIVQWLHQKSIKCFVKSVVINSWWVKVQKIK